MEVIQEFTHVRALTLLITGVEDLQLGLSLFERHQALGAFDAVLAAVALNRRAQALVSADQAFREIQSLIWWIDPASPSLDRLLGQ